MKKFFLFCFLLFSANLFAQNLVPNPSFEQYDTCPNSMYQVSKAIGWNSVRPTPDYFNSCTPPINNGNNVSVPANRWGYQYPATGNAYVGLAASYSAPNTREYIGAYLNTPLQIGVKYYTSFKVSLAAWDGLPTCTSPLCQICGVNKLGILFSTAAYSDTNPAPICNYSQVYTDSIITDTINWVTINSSFIADSAYTFLTLGNFFADSLRDSIQIRGNYCVAYYFIDDVVVSVDSTIGINELTSSPLQIFPNPTHSSFTINCPSSIFNSQLSIFNSLGQTVYQQIINQESEIINPRLAAGVYFLRVGEAVQKLVVY